MAPEIYFTNIGIKINELSNIAFKIGNLKIYWYGLIIVSAILIGYFMIDRTLKKEGSSIDEYLNFIIIVIITSILGARLYYVIFSWNYYKENFMQIFNLRAGGIAIYGAVIAAIVTTTLYCKITKKDFFKMADLFAPYLLLGQAMGRWGNFFNREAFGRTTDSLFAMALRLDTVKYVPNSVKDGIFTYLDAEYIQVHPTFLYESIGAFIIFIILLARTKNKKFNGEIFLGYIIGYSIVRLFVEGLRTDQLLFFNVLISQIVALILICIGIILYVKLLKKVSKKSKGDNYADCKKN